MENFKKYKELSDARYEALSQGEKAVSFMSTIGKIVTNGYCILSLLAFWYKGIISPVIATSVIISWVLLKILIAVALNKFAAAYLKEIEVRYPKPTTPPSTWIEKKGTENE